MQRVYINIGIMEVSGIGQEEISQCELIYFCELIYLPENTGLSLMHNIIHFVADLRVGLVK